MAKMVIFSAVQGRVLDNGKPVAGAQIERTFKWAWKDETGSDTATTGVTGEFVLPAIERRSFLGSLLPHEPVIRQSITIRHGGKAYEAWLHNRHSYANHAELGGKAIRLVCKLETPPQHRCGDIYGICEFQ